MMTSESAARHLLHLASAGDEPVPVTHMQLQKLAYYAQGWSLALRAAPLFASRIEAWPHGPVVTDLYRVFAPFRASAIDPAEGRGAHNAAEGEIRLLESIWRGYGRFSGSYLRELTHAEAPWLDARRGLSEDAPSNAEITHESLRTFFQGLDSRACARFGITRKELDVAIADARSGTCIPWSDFKRGLSGAMAD
ncbi:MAG: SocA family protein [Phycisphaeraceae bacterium]|nr:SocA family protein [Phycisphaeraceae bacterium]